VFFAAGVFAQEPPPPEKPKPGAPTIRLALARLKPDSVIDIAGDRVMTAGDDGIWVASRAGGTVTRIDAKTNKSDEAIAVGKEPCGGITTGFASLIVPLCGEPGLARVEIKTKKVTSITKGFTRSLGAPVTGVSSIWMLTDARGTLVRIDPASNTFVAEIHLNAAAQALTFGQNAIWVATAGNELLKVNAYTNVTDETIKVGKSPRSIAIGESSVWTLNSGDATVSRIDSKTNKVTMTVKLGEPIPSGEIAVGEGSVWVSAPGSPLIRIDPRTNRVVQHFSGEGGGAILIAHGALWITATPRAIWRLDPKLVEATR
jgi:YVTN family beta-propeller protein